jgi:hypothetical protein
MDVFIHRATLQEAMQFRPAFLPWPEGVEQDAAGNFFMHWPRGNNDPIRGGDYVVFRGGRPFAIFPRAEFEEKFQRIGVAEPRQMKRWKSIGGVRLYRLGSDDSAAFAVPGNGRSTACMRASLGAPVRSLHPFRNSSRRRRSSGDISCSIR